MPELILVPEVAAGATEATLLEWSVAIGDPVAVGDVVALLETDKAQVEIVAEAPGTVVRLLTEAEVDVLIGAPIAVLQMAGDDQGTLEKFFASLEAVAGPTPVQTPPAAAAGSAAAADGSATQDRTPTVVVEARDPGGRVFVSPIARRLLKDAGIELGAVSGSGPGGRIVRRDVESVIAAEHLSVASAPPSELAPDPATPAQSVAPDLTGGKAVPHTRLRRAIARRLTQSKQNVPHFYVRRTATLDALLRVRAELNASKGVRVSVNDLIVKAVARAQHCVPQANVIWTDDHLVQFSRVDIAVAIASDNGLVTPVIRDADRLSIGAIAAEISGLVGKANDGSLQQADLEGGAITVTNLGMFDVDEFTAIINPPHASILAVGAGRPAPVVRDGHVEVATLMNLVLSVDHRAIDGALAADWMRELVAGIENPYTLLV